MNKVFISQPMRGRDSDAIDEERQEILEYVQQIVGDCREIPSHFKEEHAAQMRPLECLGKSLELMSYCDVAVFAPGWEEARGCRIEHECALQYGYKIIDLSDGQLEASRA